MDHYLDITHHPLTRGTCRQPTLGAASLLLALSGLTACAAQVDPSSEVPVASNEARLSQPTDDLHGWFRSDSGVAPGFSTSIFPDEKLPALAYLTSTRQDTFRPELYVTRTGGASWQLVSGIVADGQSILGVLPRPDRAGEAYLGLAFPGALFRTRDGGASWQDITAGFDRPRYLQLVAMAPGNPRVLYVLGAAELSRTIELFRSDDSGQTWRFATVPTARGCCCRQVAATSAKRAYASSLCPNSDSSPALLQTDDGGQSWSPLALDLTFVDMFAVDPSDARTLYAANGRAGTTVGLRKSRNGGRTWFTPSEPFADRPVSALTLSNSGRIYLATNDDEPSVFVSRDGARNFIAANAGLEGQQVTSLASKPADPCAAYAIAGSRTLFRTENGGGTCRR